MAEKYRSKDTIDGIDKKILARDHRSVVQQVLDEVPKWETAFTLIFIFSLVGIVIPITSWIMIPIVIFLWRVSVKSKANLLMPMKLPFELDDMTDYNNPKPGRKKSFYKGEGSILFGNLRSSSHEIWMAGKDLLTHMLLIGTTGAGKTETLVSMSASTAFVSGGGLIYVDAKAAPKLISQFFTLARMFGREDDVRIINYMTGNQKIEKRTWKRSSNTANPFARGSADSNVQMLTSLLPTGGGDNQVFLDRAIAMVRGIMPTLVDLRDRGIINITAEKIKEYCSLDMFIKIYTNQLKIGGNQIKLSGDALKAVQGYLESVPGFDKDAARAGNKQPEKVSEQFGYSQMYFTRALSNLSITYGHIYEHELAEADFTDIILNGKILIVLVPAMEQSGEERAALGKVVLSSIKNAMSLGLGGKAEGHRVDMLESLPIDLKIPNIIIVDEYAEVATPGFAVTATQGRGLGISVCFAGQDLDGFMRASPEETGMIFGNTRLKVLMALEDPETTFQKFDKLAGSMMVMSNEQWEASDDGINAMRKGRGASATKIDRLSMKELKAQREGEAHLFERDNIHKLDIFHHGIDEDELVANIRINRMLKIKYPAPDVIEKLQSYAILEKELCSSTPSPVVTEELSDFMNTITSKANTPDNSLSWCLELFKEYDHENDDFDVEKQEETIDENESSGTGEICTNSNEQNETIPDKPNTAEQLANLFGEAPAPSDSTAQELIPEGGKDILSQIQPGSNEEKSLDETTLIKENVHDDTKNEEALIEKNDSAAKALSGFSDLVWNCAHDYSESGADRDNFSGGVQGMLVTLNEDNEKAHETAERMASAITRDADHPPRNPDIGRKPDDKKQIVKHVNQLMSPSDAF